MSQLLHIRYLTRKDIDPVKWDRCIDRSSNGLVYAYSFYLDNMARQWDALVWNDYEAVMPLTWNRKWGVKYLYQPPLTQQLGIFFSGQTLFADEEDFQSERVQAFLTEAGRHFRFAEIFLNFQNTPSQNLPSPIGSGSSIKPRMNYILSLDAPYARLHEHYSPALLKNLAAAESFSLHYTSEFNPAEAISIYYESYRERLPHVKSGDYDRFLKVCLHLEKEGGLLIRAVFEDPKPAPRGLQDRSGRQLLAVTLLLKKKNRIYLILPSTLPEGKNKQANHYLLDRLVHEFAGQDLILDFEGSDIPGIARFYKKFGPAEQPFFFYRLNRLPWPLRLFKKLN